MANNGRTGYIRRPTSDAAVRNLGEQHARRRAARWHAWLKSPECTMQDRENFARWCDDAANAAAYVALYGNLAALPDSTTAEDCRRELLPAAHAFAAPQQLHADAR
jgi:ferric-dicitrate binding protein FerR (iron transport regulator)